MAIRITRTYTQLDELECVGVIKNAYVQGAGGVFTFDYMKRRCWVCGERFKPGQKVAVAVSIGPRNYFLCAEHADDGETI